MRLTKAPAAKAMGTGIYERNISLGLAPEKSKPGVTNWARVLRVGELLIGRPDVNAPQGQGISGYLTYSVSNHAWIVSNVIVRCYGFVEKLMCSGLHIIVPGTLEAQGIRAAT